MRGQTPDSNNRWHNREVTSELRPYANCPRVFHRVEMGRASIGLYLTGALFGRVFLCHDPSLHHSNLELYSVRLGSVEGMSVGYLFRSPLALKADPYFMMFYRRGINVIEDVIKSSKAAEKKYVFSDLVIHAHDTGYLLTRLENNSVTKMLGGE